MDTSLIGAAANRITQTDQQVKIMQLPTGVVAHVGTTCGTATQVVQVDTSLSTPKIGEPWVHLQELHLLK
jgi:hypothetical protein